MTVTYASRYVRSAELYSLLYTYSAYRHTQPYNTSQLGNTFQFIFQGICRP